MQELSLTQSCPNSDELRTAGQITAVLQSRFAEIKGLNKHLKLSHQEEEKFLLGGLKTFKWIKENKRRLEGIPSYDYLAEELVTALVDRFGWREVHPGHFSSDFTFNNVFPLHLHNVLGVFAMNWVGEDPDQIPGIVLTDHQKKLLQKNKDRDEEYEDEDEE